tara:strand:+ start:62225 stop:62761 length:537 start_codon:yes stop_codon:yes gene_type:complete
MFTLLFLGQSVMAETVYKSQDDSGKTIYSDQPTPNSQEIVLPPPPKNQTPEPIAPVDDVPKSFSTPSPTEQALNEVSLYKAVMIQPKADMVFTHEIDEINIKLFLEPELHPDDRIQLKSNGKPLGGFHETTDFTIPRLNRGQYDLQAFVVSKSGKGKPKGQTEVIRIHQIRNHIPRGS